MVVEVGVNTLVVEVADGAPKAIVSPDNPTLSAEADFQCPPSELQQMSALNSTTLRQFVTVIVIIDQATQQPRQRPQCLFVALFVRRA